MENGGGFALELWLYSGTSIDSQHGAPLLGILTSQCGYIVAPLFGNDARFVPQRSAFRLALAGRTHLRLRNQGQGRAQACKYLCVEGAAPGNRAPLDYDRQGICRSGALPANVPAPKTRQGVKPKQHPNANTHQPALPNQPAQD